MKAALLKALLWIILQLVTLMMWGMCKLTGIEPDTIKRLHESMLVEAKERISRK